MLFTIFFVIGSIIFGITLFLWVGMYKEVVGLEGASVSTRPKQMKTPKTARIPTPKKTTSPKKEKKSLFGKKSEPVQKRPAFDFEEDFDSKRLEDWSNFETVRRNKDAMEDKKEMDELFGFTYKTKEDEKENVPAYQEKGEQKDTDDLSFDERYSFLFDEDEEEKETTSTKNFKQKEEENLFDFSMDKSKNDSVKQEKPLYEGFDFSKLPPISKTNKTEEPKHQRLNQDDNQMSIEERLQKLAQIMDQNSNKKN